VSVEDAASTRVQTETFTETVVSDGLTVTTRTVQTTESTVVELTRDGVFQGLLNSLG
jgi:hypothetical protein